MPKRTYTKTSDGWTQVKSEATIEEAVEAAADEDLQLIEDCKNLYENNYHNRLRKEGIELTPTQMPELVTEITHNLVNPMTKEQSERAKQKKSIKNNEKEIDDWEKEATKDAMRCLLGILCFMTVVIGITALIVYLSPSITWETIVEVIVFGILKIIMFIYKLFYDMCVFAFEWILKKCGGSF